MNGKEDPAKSFSVKYTIAFPMPDVVVALVRTNIYKLYCKSKHHQHLNFEIDLKFSSFFRKKKFFFWEKDAWRKEILVVRNKYWFSKQKHSIDSCSELCQFWDSFVLYNVVCILHD